MLRSFVISTALLLSSTTAFAAPDKVIPFEGVLDKNGDLIKELSVSQARALIKDGTISGGMIPKVETCIEAIQGGVEGVVILNGKTAHSVLLELFTEVGAGTLIVP